MADKRITDLPALTVADDSDLFPVVDVSGNITKKVSRAGLVPDSSISAAKLADGAVTPAKRSGGFYATDVTFSSGTGTKSITGFGFRPKEVQFISNFSSASSARMSIGGAVATSGGFYQYVSTVTATSSGASEGLNIRCMRIISASGALEFAASFTSFDADGVTINVNNDSANFRSWFVIARG